MLSKTQFIFAGLIIVLGAFIFSIFALDNTENIDTTLDVTTVQIHDTNLTLLVARTDAQHQQGLSNRKELVDVDGMIFYFTPPREQVTFWMNNMLFDLDMIWISDNTIVQIDRNVLRPFSGEQPETRTSPKGQIIHSVIEVPATHSASFSVGDTVRIES